MKVWTITGFEGFYPVGTAAVVVAASAVEAAMLLRTVLANAGLVVSGIKPEHFELLCTNRPSVVVLNDGNY